MIPEEAIMIIQTKSTRSGITLMEVLISIGILAVGLTAVITIIPAAGSQAQKALVETTKANVGLAAMNDAITRGILLPQGTPPFVIDPFNPFLDEDQDGANDTDQTNGEPLYFWPNAGLSLELLGGLSGITADEVFRSQDDLSFSLDESDQDGPPKPLFFGPGNAKRLSAGVYSWLATLVPEVPEGGENYLLSVVTFHQRDLTPPATRTVTKAPAESNSVTFSWSGSLGSFRETFPRGSVVLLHDTGKPDENIPPTWEWRQIIFPSLDDDNDTGQLMFNATVADTQGTRQLHAFRGAVGITERLVRLEGASPWTQ